MAGYQLTGDRETISGASIDDTVAWLLCMIISANPVEYRHGDFEGGAMSKKSLSEADICAKYITPSIIQAGWDEATQIRREVYFTKGRIIVRGKLITRGNH